MRRTLARNTRHRGNGWRCVSHQARKSLSSRETTSPASCIDVSVFSTSSLTFGLVVLKPSTLDTIRGNSSRRRPIGGSARSFKEASTSSFVDFGPSFQVPTFQDTLSEPSGDIKPVAITGRRPVGVSARHGALRNWLIEPQFGGGLQ